MAYVTHTAIALVFCLPLGKSYNTPLLLRNLVRNAYIYSIIQARIKDIMLDASAFANRKYESTLRYRLEI